jgi:inosine-uridine nucleoside N-ribohydrolase
VKDLFTDMFNTLCDPLAAFPMLMPKTVTGMYYVYGEVCREGARTKGFLAIDWLKMKGSNEPNLQIICHLDWDLVFNTMVESLE